MTSPRTVPKIRASPRRHEHVTVDHRVASCEQVTVDHECGAVDIAPDLGVAVDRDERAVDGLPEHHGHVTDPDATVLVVAARWVRSRHRPGS